MYYEIMKKKKKTTVKKVINTHFNHFDKLLFSQNVINIYIYIYFFRSLKLNCITVF